MIVSYIANICWCKKIKGKLKKREILRDLAQAITEGKYYGRRIKLTCRLRKLFECHVHSFTQNLNLSKTISENPNFRF